MQYELPDDEREDMEYDIEGMDDLVCSDEEEGDLVSILQEEGVLGFLPSRSDNQIEPKDTKTLTFLLHGLTLAEKGHQLIAKACSAIKSAIARNPELYKLSALLEMIKTTDPSLVSGATARSKFKQSVQGESKSDAFKPRKITSGEKEGKFQCRICEVVKNSWVGCDSHIRKNHSHVFYGPCRFCNEFTSPAYDSLRKHQAKCQLEASSSVLSEEI